MRENGDPLDSLKPQPGQINPYRQKFHPLPGKWAQEQLNGTHRVSHEPVTHKAPTELQRALAEEKARIDHSMRQQGITPGRPVYENPRETQNTLLPVEKYASG